MEKKSLLIVDDNPDVLNIIKKILSDMFSEISTATNVDEAQDILLEKKFSLITLDINLQGRNGSEVVKFMRITPDCPNANTPIILISGLMTPEFVEKNKHRFAGILVKPFDSSELKLIVEKAVSSVVVVDSPSSEADFSDITALKCKMPFTITELEEKVDDVLKEIKKDNNLKKLFSKLKIDHDPHNYFSAHTGILINISIGISMKLEWSTDNTLSKFVYAAYLHDMALAEKPELARINSNDELLIQKAKLTKEDYKLVFEHTNLAGNTLAEINEIPPDVVTMVRQHHELPKANGYPAKISHSKIIPLASVFIIAHDLSDYILSNPKWNLKTYMEAAKIKFSGPHFIKALNALETFVPNAKK